MQDAIILDWVILALVCVFAAIAAVFWLNPRRSPARADSDMLGGRCARDPVFLFDGHEMIGISTKAQAYVDPDDEGFDWTALHKKLTGRFPGFPDSQDEIQASRKLVVPAGDESDPGEAVCEWIDGITRVHLRGLKIRETPETPDSRSLEMLHIAMQQAPYPVWHTDTKGTVCWCNAAYRTLCNKTLGNIPDTIPTLFPPMVDQPRKGKKSRSSIAVHGSDKRLWFDVSAVRHEAGYMCYAMDINAVVDAEIAQRNFVQTLAKTFAQLPIGLAIFDRNRQLALFNPALIDLTALAADFLSARPNLLSFFDRLRDNQMMPEPKNYDSWRQQMADLVEAAADGRYQETWSLPSGSVYSVSGRPHPDGAIAFLIEDITAEITLTRRFRSDLEMDQAILDRLDDAIAVFSQSGGLTFSNAAYRRMFSVDPDKSFAQMSILDATRTWQDHCQATPVLGEIRDFVASREGRADWQAQFLLKSGEAVDCSVFPILNGATMVSFNRVNPGVPPIAVATPLEPAKEILPG